MKIIIEIEYLDPQKGGAETYTALLCKYLACRGHNIEILTMGYNNIEETNKIKLIKVPTQGIQKWQRWISFVKSTKKISQKRGADIVLAMNRAGGMDIFQPHGGTIQRSQIQNILKEDNKLKRMAKYLTIKLSPKFIVARYLDRLAYKQSKHFIALSKLVKNDMIRYHKIDENCISLIYNGVDTVRFHPKLKKVYRDPIRKKLSIPDNSLVFSFVAHNFSLKGLKELILASADIDINIKNKCFWIIAGNGKIKKFRKLVNQLGLDKNFIFLGAVNNIEQIYAASDAYVHPTWYDPCSLVLLEALAMGLPVITTKFNGASELIINKNVGFVIDTPKNIKALTQRMEDLIKIDLRSELSLRARELAESLSWDHHYKKIENIIESVAQHC